jgi:hypothetical protein
LRKTRWQWLSINTPGGAAAASADRGAATLEVDIGRMEKQARGAIIGSQRWP